MNADERRFWGASRKLTRGERLGPVGIALRWAFILAILTIAAYSVQLPHRQMAMRRWPTTLATVRHFDPRLDWCKEQGCYAAPLIDYVYEVDGKTYSSCRLNPDEFHYQGKEQYRTDLGGIGPGSVLTCWYNPTDPAEAYIVNRGVTGGTIIILAVNALLLLAAVAALRDLRRSKLRD